MHMWHHVTNHLIISNDKDSNSENRIKLRVRDNMTHCGSTRQHLSSYMTCGSVITIRVLIIDTGRVSA
jgi:hypothetical protein